MKTKTTYNFNSYIKEKARVQLKKFLKKRLKNPEKAKVLCLPGSEALEIFNVYDKLGVKRENIVCLERVTSEYRKIVDLNLGCEIHNVTVLEYLKNNPEVEFDVISLDYMGHISSHLEDILLAAQNNMASNCVVMTNFCGTREKKNTQLLYQWYHSTLNEEETNIIKLRAGSEMAGNLKDCRESIWAITNDIIEKANTFRNPMAEVIDRDSNLSKRVKKIKGNLRFAAEKTAADDPELSKFLIILRDILTNYDYFGNLESDIMSKMCVIIETYFKLFFDEGNYTDAEGNSKTVLGLERTDFYTDKFKTIINLAKAVKLSSSEVPRLIDTHSFKYVNISGMPMYCDIYYYKKQNKFDYLKNNLNYEAPTLMECLCPMFADLNNTDMLVSIVKKTNTLMEEEDSCLMPSREHIGSESEILKRLGITITEQELELAKEKDQIAVETSNENVVETTPKISKKTSLGEQGEEKEHNFKPGEIQKAVRYMVNNGFEDEEILEKTNISRQSLGAFKAHRTRTIKGDKPSYQGVDWHSEEYYPELLDKITNPELN